MFSAIVTTQNADVLQLPPSVPLLIVVLMTFFPFFRFFQIILHFGTNIISSTKILAHSYFTDLKGRVMIYIDKRTSGIEAVSSFSLLSYSLLCIPFRCLCSTVWNNSQLECKGVTG
jgi:hypothetical protein